MGKLQTYLALGGCQATVKLAIGKKAQLSPLLLSVGKLQTYLALGGCQATVKLAIGKIVSFGA